MLTTSHEGGQCLTTPMQHLPLSLTKGGVAAEAQRGKKKKKKKTAGQRRESFSVCDTEKMAWACKHQDAEVHKPAASTPILVHHHLDGG